MGMTLQKANIIDKQSYRVFTYTLKDDGILYIHVDSDDYNVDTLKKANEVIGKMTKGKAVPLLITHDRSVIPPVETRTFWAQKDSCPYSKADAFIIYSTTQKLIGNFYMAFNKPARPTRLFTNKEDAIKWLSKFLVKNSNKY